jgi:NADPH:quinone reductase
VVHEHDDLLEMALDLKSSSGRTVAAMRAIRQHRHGGPEELTLEEVPDPEPGVGQVRIAVEAAGVHLLDTSIRSGSSFGPLGPPELPMTPGREVAGLVDSVGGDVDPSWIGRRVVVHLGAASGGYASLAVASVGDLFELPDDASPTDAVAMVGTGRTALAVLEVADIDDDDVVVVPSAAGGLGALLVQSAVAAGATVVGLAGGPTKVDVVRRLGAHIAIDYLDETWPDQVRASLGERRPTITLDGVGGDVGRAAFDLVGPGGRVVLFGYSSGTPTTIDADLLFSSGVTVTAAIGARIAARPGGIRGLAADALAALAEGRLDPLVHPPFSLTDAADAHRALEARETAGKVVLVP